MAIGALHTNYGGNPMFVRNLAIIAALTMSFLASPVYAGDDITRQTTRSEIVARMDAVVHAVDAYLSSVAPKDAKLLKTAVAAETLCGGYLRVFRDRLDVENPFVILREEDFLFHQENIRLCELAKMEIASRFTN